MNAYLVNGSTNMLMKMEFSKNFLGRSNWKTKLWVEAKWFLFLFKPCEGPWPSLKSFQHLGLVLLIPKLRRLEGIRGILLNTLPNPICLGINWTSPNGHNGAQVRWQEDKWLGNFILKEQYPTLYNIKSKKDIIVAQAFSTAWLNISSCGMLGVIN
jgi:hypothetical protein